MQSITIDVDADLKKRFRIKCLKNDSNMTTKLTELIEQFIKKG